MRNRPSLLFICYDRPNKLGGPIVNYLRLLPELQKYFDVNLLSFYYKSSPNAKIIENYGVKVFYKRKSILDIEFLEIKKLLLRLNPDIFIPDVSHAGWYLGAQVKNIPIILHCRSYDNQNLERFKLFENKKNRPLLYGVSVSGFLSKTLSKKYPLIPQSIIPSGVIIEKNPGAVYNLANIEIVYAGRFEKSQKRMDLLDKLIMESESDNVISFKLIGSGSYFLESLLHNRKNLRLIGNLTGVEYKIELSKSNYFILLSEYEGTPGALLDAMSVGLIPIINNFPGADEVIKHGKNGFIIDAANFNYSDLKLLIDSIGEREYSKLSKEAIETIKNKYALNTAVFRWVDLINSFNINVNYLDSLIAQKHIKVKNNISGQGSHIPLEKERFYKFWYTLAALKRFKNPFLIWQ